MNNTILITVEKGPLRRGAALFNVVLILFIAALMGGFIWYSLSKPTASTEGGPLVKEVIQGPFEFVVLEQGEIESASNIELRCEVKARGSGGGSAGSASILEVVPEGTLVQAGDVLVRLDSSSLEQDQVQQQISCNSGESLVVQAKNTLDAAKISRREYLEGTFKLEERNIQGEVFVAEQNLRSAQLAYESAERLAAKNIITSLQLEGSKFAVDKAQNELDAANGKLEVLRKYTKEKMLKQFDSDIATAEAKVKSEESSYNLELQKLKDIETQISKCTIKAPQSGQVVYANKYNTSGRGGSTAEFVVEAGAVVREQQPIVRLPDAANMQVKALVNEARVTLVKVGMPVLIRVDALKDELIQGEVIKVNQYAEPGGWGGGNIKKYATFVKIINPPPTIRSGMNTEVRIFVDRREDALQVPVQALVEQKGHFFCVVQRKDQYSTVEVTVPTTNDKTAVISPLTENAIAAADQVVMNPRSKPGLLKIPADLKDAIAQPILPAMGPVDVRPASNTSGADSKAPGKDPSKGGGDRPKGPPSAGQMIKSAMELDTDADGKLSKAEIGLAEERRKPMLEAADRNSDGLVDKDELTRAAAETVKKIQERMKEAGGPSGGGGAL